MIEALSFPFMQRALIAGLIVAVLAGYFGVFVVQRKLSFLGTGLAHAAFGGVALGLLLDTQPLLVALPFTILASIGITFVRDKTKLGADTTIGIFFAISMALGIVFLALKDDYATDAFAYLFGSILTVTSTDLWITGSVLLLSLLSLPLWRSWAYATFDRELAQADSVNVTRDDYLLSMLVAVTVVASVKVLGIVLVTAFLVIPAATARLLARTFFAMTIIAVLIGLISTVAGLFLSYALDLPSGATIILTQSGIFFGAMPFRRN